MPAGLGAAPWAAVYVRDLPTRPNFKPPSLPLGPLPCSYASPRAAALSHLLIKLLDDALCETAYLAEVAGLHYGIW